MPLLNAWASTIPSENGHGDMPKPGAPCGVTDCREPLRSREEVYRVIELPDGEWVCWRHIARESGPTYPITIGGDEDE